MMLQMKHLTSLQEQQQTTTQTSDVTAADEDDDEWHWQVIYIEAFADLLISVFQV